MKKQDTTRICPECGSTDIDIVVTDVGEVYICRVCWYPIEKTWYGLFPEIERSKVEQFRKELQKRKRIKH